MARSPLLRLLLPRLKLTDVPIEEVANTPPGDKVRHIHGEFWPHASRILFALEPDQIEEAGGSRS
jgi:hypothetical protein